MKQNGLRAGEIDSKLIINHKTLSINQSEHFFDFSLAYGIY
jgi:hypothetical protein